MDTNEILNNELNFFKHHTTVFTTCEIADNIEDHSISFDQIYDALSKDPRFLYIGKTDEGNDQFISKKKFTEWFIYLIICLARAEHPYITAHQLKAKINSLGISGKERNIPQEIIKWGQDLGFLVPVNKYEKYFSPLSHILSFVKSYPYKTICNLIRDSLEPINMTFDQFIMDTVERAIFQLAPRELYVILARGNLSIDNYKTLEQIANELKVTRELVRQIEIKAQSRTILIRPFLTVLIRDVIRGRGSLIHPTSSTTPARIFIAKCLCIPYANLQDIGITVLGEKNRELSIKMYPKTFFEQKNMITRLEYTEELKLIESDIVTLLDYFTKYRFKKPTIREKVYLALQAIGKPAHYSVVINVYNSMFPEAFSSERQIFSALGSEKKVVWVGANGIYALREWGYEKPAKSLSDTVQEIILEKYKISLKPVPFEVILSELGKYRKFVNLDSLKTAMSLNPYIKQVSRGCFIPQKSARYQNYDSKNKIDNILSEFEKKFQN